MTLSLFAAKSVISVILSLKSAFSGAVGAATSVDVGVACVAEGEGADEATPPACVCVCVNV